MKFSIVAVVAAFAAGAFATTEVGPSPTGTGVAKPTGTGSTNPPDFEGSASSLQMQGLLAGSVGVVAALLL